MSQIFTKTMSFLLDHPIEIGSIMVGYGVALIFTQVLDFTPFQDKKVGKMK